MTSMIEKVARAVHRASAYGLDLFRGFYPFMICLLGAAAILALQGKGWAGPLIAGVSFAWAIDLAQARAAAKARSEVAGQFIAALTNGKDSSLTVKIIYAQPDTALSEEGS